MLVASRCLYSFIMVATWAAWTRALSFSPCCTQITSAIVVASATASRFACIVKPEMLPKKAAGPGGAQAVEQEDSRKVHHHHQYHFTPEYPRRLPLASAKLHSRRWMTKKRRVDHGAKDGAFGSALLQYIVRPVLVCDNRRSINTGCGIKQCGVPCNRTPTNGRHRWTHQTEIPFTEHPASISHQRTEHQTGIGVKILHSRVLKAN
jgi:hypothetical protein